MCVCQPVSPELGGSPQLSLPVQLTPVNKCTRRFNIHPLFTWCYQGVGVCEWCVEVMIFIGRVLPLAMTLIKQFV